jgi:hypothetical protein
MKSLFDEFISDGGLSTCREILDAVHAKEKLPDRVIDEFSSNCFDITLNYTEGFALLEDVLDTSPSRQQRFVLDEFIRRLAQAEAALRAPEQR